MSETKKESKKAKAKTSRMLITEDGDLTEEFHQLLKDIFTRFDKNQDAKWDEEELDDFARTCNGKPFDKNSKEEIKENFEVSEEGWLTLKGFIEMYHLQTSAEESETWKDLEKLGYNKQLQKILS